MANSGNLGNQQEGTKSWESLIDYLKTIITLASALLTATIAVADKLVLGVGSTWARFSLEVSWFALVATILAALLSVALCVNYLRNRTRETGAILTANSAFFLFAVSAVALFFAGYLRVSVYAEPNIEASLARAIVAVRSAAARESGWVATSAEWIEHKRQYKVRLRSEPSGYQYDVVVPADGGSIIALTRL